MRKLWKKILAGVLVAGMMLAPAAGVSTTVANAEDVLLIAPNPNASTVYDFTDGSIIPTDTNGKSDVTSGNLTVKVGTKNAYGYNGPDHGVQFKAGNTIEIKVDGPTKVEVGDCQFSAYDKLTMTSADGSWTQTVDAKKGCQHNDGSVVVFEYTGGANTLVLGVEGTCYIPKITTTPINMEPTGPVVTVYNFKDGSIIPTDTNGKNDVTSGDLTVKVGTKNAYGYNGPDHGVQFKAGNTIEIKVGGPVKIAVGDCQFSAYDKLTMTSADGSWTQTADAKKGCEHNDGSVVVFEYSGDANTLILGFEGTCYVPSITVTTVEAAVSAVPVFYNLADGSVVPESYNGSNKLNGTLESADGALKFTSAGKLYFHDSQHGLVVDKGDTIEIKVGGPTKIEFGDCEFNNATSLTLTSADGSWTQTVDAQKGCQHNNGSVVVFTYDGEATTLKMTLDKYIYLPNINVIPVGEDAGDDNGVPADSMFMYNFSDGSVIPTSYTADAPISGTIESADGFLAITGKNAAYATASKKGAVFSDRDYMEIKVAGDAIISLVLGSDTEAGSEWKINAGKGETDVEAVSAVPAEYAGQVAVIRYTGVATTLRFTASSSKLVYIHGVNVINLPKATETPALVGNGKIDVWDFGLEELDPEKYNNMLTKDIVNSWYPADVEIGSTGATINSFATEDIFFNTGNAVNSRYRTMAEGVTKYDDKSKKFTLEDGTSTTLNGFVYSNSGSTALVNMGIRLYEGDALTMYLSSNGGVSNVYVETPSGKIIVAPTNGNSGEATKQVVYAGETGIYRLYTLDEKLVVCRLEREHKAPVAISGNVTVPEGLKGDYAVVFTCTETGAEVVAAPEGGKYSAWLYDSYHYTMSLKNANGYVIESDINVAVEGTDALTRDVKVGRVDLATMTGKIKGLSETALKNLKLSFVNEETVYVPEFTINGSDITVQFEKGVEYKVVFEGINDYVLSSADTVKLTKDTTKNITFKAKPVYKVTLKTTGMSSADKKNTTLVFTNINEEGYVYTFKATGSIKLRDGQYSVKVVGADKYNYGYLKDVKVAGEATTLEIAFEKADARTWDFSKLNKAFGGTGILKDGDKATISDLILTGNISENKQYLLVKEGTVYVPVNEGDTVTVNYCYESAFYVGSDKVEYKVVKGDCLNRLAKKFECTIWNIVDLNPEITNPDLIFRGQKLIIPVKTEAVKIDSKSGSTTKIESVTYTALADGYLNITGFAGENAKNTYITSITTTPKAADPVAYKEVVTVGTDKEYATITAALDAIAKMDRKADERVTVMIDPGNYDEMLVVTVPNVTFKNAAGEASSLDLTNKGVDIAENAVRITSYYGYGYSYYSMGTDTKYDAELLEVNKANGYHTYDYKGGKTDGSYWGATVVVTASGFTAEGIIFENSFNQYVSAKEAEDVLVRWDPKLPDRPKTVGDTSVQDYTFKHQAAAMAVIQDAYFVNCKFVGRQDVIYGETGATVAFEECDLYGSTDYLMGPMTAVFYKCNLVINTSDHKNDYSHLTAPQQSSGRGYIFWDCIVTSTTPGVDTASTYGGKNNNTFGRPWTPNTSEAVFVNTVIEAADEQYGGGSLISAAGWDAGLGGKSAGMQEYGTVEKSVVDNSAARADWATVLTELKLIDGTDISTFEKAVEAFFGSWNPFK